jgi:hypothetical protein
MLEIIYLLKLIETRNDFAKMKVCVWHTVSKELLHKVLLCYTMYKIDKQSHNSYKFCGINIVIYTAAHLHVMTNYPIKYEQIPHTVSEKLAWKIKEKTYNIIIHGGLYVTILILIKSIT